MSHCVTGLVASQFALERFARQHALHDPLPLAEKLALLPLRDQDLDAFLPLPLSGNAEGFSYWSDQLLAELKNASSSETLVYFETDYFGGMGIQGAAVLQNGELIFGPKATESGPINEALALLGVRIAPSATDEFQTLGLHRHRHTQDWLECQS